ncbi:MAG TPA: kelch repeat-containing protein [Polyangiaceae bacterium]|nr:kelch repeat-containing protein [Polyangiaceae bacterium]
MTRLRPLPDGVAAQRGDDTLDLGQLLTSDLLNELTQPNRQWATPVESTNDRVKRNLATVFASVESPWTGNVAIREFVATPDGAFTLRPALPTPSIVPAARSGAHVVLSALERAVYLVGGVPTSGNGLTAPTSDIWRYDLESGAWTALGREGKVLGAALQSVAATAYDTRNHELYVLSNVQSISAFGTKPALRLTSVNTQSGVARTLADLPTLATSTAVSLGVTRDQTLVLATQKDAQNVQVFELDPLQARPAWNGYAALTGQLDGDLFTPGEVFLPILNGNVDHLVTLTRATLRQKIGASSAGDQDADGVVDALDDCPKTYDPSQQGCPDANAALLYASFRLTLDDQVKTSTGSLLVSAGTQPTSIGIAGQIGTLESKPAVTLKDRARASGSVTSSGSISLLNGATAAGGTKPNVPLSIDSLSSFTVTFPAPGAPVPVGPNQNQTLAPGSYGDVHIYGNSTLFLSSGAYYFQSFFVEPKATVVINSRSGPVRIFSKNSLTFRGAFTGQSAGTPRVLLGYMGTTQASIDSGIDGTVVAPNSKLLLPSVVHNGAFYAKEIEVQAGATVNYVPFGFPWLPGQ